MAEEAALSRFLRYVQIDTQSQFDVGRIPSTEKQFDLARLLADELRTIGCEEVTLNEHAIVMATIPASVPSEKTLALFAHLDTSPCTPGKCRPQLHRNYEGGGIALNDEISIDAQELAPYVGQDIVTTDGTTLLGADDKAGVAAIMAATEKLIKHPGQHPHGRIRVCFTPDEEINRGMDCIDLQALGADVGYTLDGMGTGTLNGECFNAVNASVVIRGRTVHPGSGFGVLVSPIRIAGDFIAMLPKDEAPETTTDHDGFFHPTYVSHEGDTVTVKLILRDFDYQGLQRRVARLDEYLERLRSLYPGAEVHATYREMYRNMKDVLDSHPEVMAKVREAYRRQGIKPNEIPIRGGTDGARLTWMGLPTPNIFTGGVNFHSKREFLPVPSLNKLVDVLLSLAALYCPAAHG